MKKIFFLILLTTFFTGFYAAQDNNDPVNSSQQKEFSIDELVENANVPEQMPTSRELPWYIDAIQKPATRVLLYACTAWDWIKQKTHHVTTIFWHKQEKKHEQKA